MDKKTKPELNIIYEHESIYIQPNRKITKKKSEEHQTNVIKYSKVSGPNRNNVFVYIYEFIRMFERTCALILSLNL